MARSKTDPAYINDELLKVAVLGTRHHPLDVTTLPAALQDFATQLLEHDEPEAALFTIINLCSTWERASNEGLVEVSSEIVPVKPPQVVGARYIAPELISRLTAPTINAVAWTAILVRLRGSGLKVPPHYAQAFLRNFKRLRPSLPPLYKDFPVEFLDSSARLWLHYASDDGLVCEPHSWDDWGASEHKAKIAELLEQGAYDAALDLLEPSFSALPKAERLGILQLWQAHWLKFLSSGYQSGFLPVGVTKAASPQLSAEALGQALVEALSKLYGADVVTNSLETKPVGMTDVAAQVEVALKTDTSLKLAITAQATVSVQKDKLRSLEHGGFGISVGQRVEQWLMRVVRSERVLEVKAAAAQLLRMLPGGRLEVQMVEFARKVFSVRGRRGPVLKRELSRSHQAIAAELVTFFPELGASRDYTEHSRRMKLSNTDREMIACLTFFLPIEMWFELFCLKRSGNANHDATRLFAAFKEYFPGWDYIRYRDDELKIYVPYLLQRIQLELGSVFFEALFEHCGDQHILYETRLLFLGQLSYTDRELCPLVSGSHRFNYSLWENPMMLLMKSTTKFFTEPLSSWGPKFSAFYFEQLLAQFVVGQRPNAYFYFKKYQAPYLSVIALSLDPVVRQDVQPRIKESIAAFTEDIARFEAHGMLDQYDSLLTYSRIARHDLQLLLRYFEWADELKAMCAQALPAA